MIQRGRRIQRWRRIQRRRRRTHRRRRRIQKERRRIRSPAWPQEYIALPPAASPPAPPSASGAASGAAPAPDAPDAPDAPTAPGARGGSIMMKRRKLKLKAKLESTVSHFSVKRSVPGGFNVGLIGSTCTALP